jgi:membrane dipeptidase
MKIVDMHSDYAMNVHQKHLEMENNVLIDHHLPKLEKGKINVEITQIGGDFELHGIDYHNSMNVIKTVDSITEEIDENLDKFYIIKNSKDLQKINNGSQVGFLFSSEGIASIGYNPFLLRNYYKLGLRSIALTHNRRNLFADGCMEPLPGGLSIRGKSIVEEISYLSMILDLVHISEPSFFDVLEIYQKPFIVSHSNTKAINYNPRNLSDDQIKKVGERNGVIGVTAVGVFIDENVKNATIDRLIDHIDYIVDLIGIDHVGFGGDFIDYMREEVKVWLIKNNLPLDGLVYPEGLCDASGIPNLITGLESRGYSKQDVEKIMGENFIQLAKEVLN